MTHPHIRPKRLRRCQLSVPGSSEKMMTKAAALDVDYVFLDLEDAVAPDAKRPARRKIVEAINGLDWGRKTVCVRINDLTTEYAYEDIIEVIEGAHARLDLIMLTKCMGPDDITFCDKLISMMEKKLKLTKTIGLETLIEEVEAMQRVDEIAAATREDPEWVLADVHLAEAYLAAASAGEPWYAHEDDGASVGGSAAPPGESTAASSSGKAKAV